MERIIFISAVIGFCLVLSFLFSGMEAGVLAMNQLRIRQLMRAGSVNAQVLNGYLERREDFLWTILIGNTLANFAAVGLLVLMLQHSLAQWPWLLLGALSQIVGTGMMLLAMNDRSFVVTTAYLKTEAIQTAIFGFIFLSDHLTVLKVIAILIATAGVVIAALRPGSEKGFADLKPTLLGLAAAAAFALSAVGFRGAVIVVPGVSFVTAASYTLVLGLFVQTLVLTIYLLFRAPDVLKKILGLWRPSMLAGFMGAFASQFWFLAFALTAAANVRTLALVEVLFAQAVAYYSFKQPLSARELAGIVLIVVGVALLVAA